MSLSDVFTFGARDILAQVAVQNSYKLKGLCREQKFIAAINCLH